VNRLVTNAIGFNNYFIFWKVCPQGRDVVDLDNHDDYQINGSELIDL
jgi:hypothetical protein